MRELLNQQALLKNRNKVDEFGEVNYGFGSIVNCRLELESKYIKDESGIDIVFDGKVFLDANTEANEGDILEYNEESYKIESVNIYFDELGNEHHKECMLKYYDV